MSNPDAGRISRPSRIIITGANGSGKSHLAKRLESLRPDLPIIRFDAFKLKTQWRKRPRHEVERSLTKHVAEAAWILEGGPSLLPIVRPKADCIIWLDPSAQLRAWRLFKRPWQHLGRTRPELPDNNPDSLWRQWAFAIQSLRKTKQTNAYLQQHLMNEQIDCLFRCQTHDDVETACTYVAHGKKDRI